MTPEKEPTKQQETMSKKAYTKPALAKVELKAEEAVLSLCKTGLMNECPPDLNCSSALRS